MFCITLSATVVRDYNMERRYIPLILLFDNNSARQGSGKAMGGDSRFRDRSKPLAFE